MPQITRFGKRLSLLVSVAVLGLFYSPIYAHHVPGATSAVMVISVPSCSETNPPNPACTRIATTANGLLSCTTDSLTKNVTCMLPHGFKVPATVVTGQPQFEFTTNFPVLDTTKGAGFLAECNASGGICNATTKLSFRNSGIKRLAGGNSTQTVQTVKIVMGFTMGLLPDSANDSILDPTAGFAHWFSSRGTMQGARNPALDNAHSVKYSFTYVKSDSQCGTTTTSTPEPFSLTSCLPTTAQPDLNAANCVTSTTNLLNTCTKTKTVTCSSPSTNSVQGITCNTGGVPGPIGSQIVKTSNTFPPTASYMLQDLVQRTCTDPLMFGATGNPQCRAIVRQNATVTYGFKVVNEMVNVTQTAGGGLGEIKQIVFDQESDSLKCDLHNSEGGLRIDPNTQGSFQIDVLGGPVDTSSMVEATTFFGFSGGTFTPLPDGTFAPGGGLIPAQRIRHGFDFNEDGIPDVKVDFDAGDLNTAGITCALYGGQSPTFILKSQGNVEKTFTIIVSGKGTGQNKGQVDHGTFTDTKNIPLSCEFAALVKPCDNQLPPP